VRGFVNEDFIDLSAETRANLEAVAATPSSALGSTRDKPDLAYCRNILASLKAHGAAWFLYIGGNDTAETVRIVSLEAAKEGYDLRSIHIPKTIDNDLMESDHEIEVYFGGVLAGSPSQPQLVLDGVADMAVILSGLSQLWFPDDTVLELPGLFHDTREATLSYTELIRANALRGYEDFFVIGALSSGPGTVHSRKRLTSLSDLEGMKISARSTIEATALERLGEASNVLALPQATDAISAGSIDGTAVPPAVFPYFGIGRLTTYHYLLPISAAPLALVMNRKKFDTCLGKRRASFENTAANGSLHCLSHIGRLLRRRSSIGSNRTLGA
jgi:hypothetical protein